MQITICINTSNDTFQEDMEGEVKAVLKKAFALIKQGSANLTCDGEYKLIDTNGNVYATFSISHYI